MSPVPVVPGAFVLTAIDVDPITNERSRPIRCSGERGPCNEGGVEVTLRPMTEVEAERQVRCDDSCTELGDPRAPVLDDRGIYMESMLCDDGWSLGLSDWRPPTATSASETWRSPLRRARPQSGRGAPAGATPRR